MSAEKKLSPAARAFEQFRAKEERKGGPKPAPAQSAREMLATFLSATKLTNGDRDRIMVLADRMVLDGVDEGRRIDAAAVPCDCAQADCPSCAAWSGIVGGSR